MIGSRENDRAVEHGLVGNRPVNDGA